jgi:hypothetical protein
VKPVVLLDTNVWVSALLNPEGAPARVVNLWREGAIDVVAALPILEEIGDVLHRPRIRKKYAIDEAKVEGYLRLISGRASMVSVTGALKLCRDPDDDRILEAASAGKAECLVTRDDDVKRDLDLIRQMNARGVQVLSVSQFLAKLGR